MILLLAFPARRAQSVTELLEARTLDRLRQFERSLEGVLGPAAIDLTTGRSILIHGDTVFPQASVIKVPVMVAMYQAERAGRLRFDDKIHFAPADLIEGSAYLKPILQHNPIGVNIRELITRIVNSDNTAANSCIALAGMDHVNRAMVDLGFQRTRLRCIMLDTAAAAHNEEKRLHSPRNGALDGANRQGKDRRRTGQPRDALAHAPGRGRHSARSATRHRNRVEDRRTVRRAFRDRRRVSTWTAFSL